MNTPLSETPSTRSLRVVASFDFQFLGADPKQIFDGRLNGSRWDYTSENLPALVINPTSRRVARTHIVEAIGFNPEDLARDINAMPCRCLAGVAETVEVLQWNRHYQKEAPVYALNESWNVADGHLFLYFDNKTGSGDPGRSVHSAIYGDAPDFRRPGEIFPGRVYVVVIGNYLNK